MELLFYFNCFRCQIFRDKKYQKHKEMAILVKGPQFKSNSTSRPILFNSNEDHCLYKKIWLSFSFSLVNGSWLIQIMNLIKCQNFMEMFYIINFY